MKKTRKTEIIFDGLKKYQGPMVFDYPLARYVSSRKHSPVWHSPWGITSNFSIGAKFGGQLARIRSVDSLTPLSAKALGFKRKVIFREPRKSYDLYNEIRERYKNAGNYFSDLVRGSVQGVSAVRMWNVSIVASMIFGMFFMTMIYRYLGQGASAKESGLGKKPKTGNELVLGDETAKKITVDENDEEIKVIRQLLAKYTEQQKESIEGSHNLAMEKEIRNMTAGYPIEKMAPYIADKDRVVAAFLVGIARKESEWGKHSPVLKGQDCFNYWGFKLKRDRMGTGGHTCFDSPKDAVDAVASRINKLVYNEKMKTPDKMVIAWKCGYDCSWDDPKSVKKWASDVDKYFSELDK